MARDVPPRASPPCPPARPRSSPRCPSAEWNEAPHDPGQPSRSAPVGAAHLQDLLPRPVRWDSVRHPRRLRGAEGQLQLRRPRLLELGRAAPARRERRFGRTRALLRRRPVGTVCADLSAVVVAPDCKARSAGAARSVSAGRPGVRLRHRPQAAAGGALACGHRLARRVSMACRAADAPNVATRRSDHRLRRSAAQRHAAVAGVRRQMSRRPLRCRCLEIRQAGSAPRRYRGRPAPRPARARLRTACSLQGLRRVDPLRGRPGVRGLDRR